jgi:hypothetical protein
MLVMVGASFKTKKKARRDGRASVVAIGGFAGRLLQAEETENGGQDKINGDRHGDADIQGVPKILVRRGLGPA